MTLAQRLRATAARLFGLAYPEVKPMPRGRLTNPVLMANPRLATTESFIRNPSLLVQRKTLRVYYEMRRDDMVKAALALKKQFMLVSGWKVESPEGMDEDWEVTKFVHDCFMRLDGSFENALLQVMTALDFGFSVSEKIYAPDKENGKLRLRCLNTVAPDDINFLTDPYGALLGIDQAGNRVNNTLETPLSKFIVFTWDADFGNWYGRSDLEAAHRPWLMKSQAYNWMGILLERFGIPPTLVHYDESAIPKEVQDELKIAVERWQSGAWGLIPRGENKDSIEFYSPELAGQTGTVFIPAFKMMNDDIARALLMPGLLGMTPDTQEGSYARSQTHFDVFMLVIEHGRRELADGVVNEQIVKQLVDLNYPGVKDYPKFKFLPLGDEVKAELLTLWGTLTGQRVVQTTPADEDHIRKQMKFPDMKTAAASAGDTDPGASPYGPGLQPTDPDNPMNPANPDSPLNPANQPELPAPDAGGKKPPPRGKGGKFAKRHQADGLAPGNDGPRPLTTHERKVDFALIQREMDEVEGAYTQRLRDDLMTIRDAVVAEVRKEFKPTLAYAKGWTVLPKTDAFYDNFMAFMKDGFARGRDSIRREIPAKTAKFEDLPMADLDDALDYLKAKALWVTGVTDDKILSEVRQALMQGVANGETLDEIVDRLREVFRPYVEKSVDDKGFLLEPARLETIVRTNLTEVYNQGRLVQGSMADEFLEAWQYSAIIDARTTEVCKHLDRRIFAADDPRLASVRPPRHFNCRSVLVPIVVGEPIESGDRITDDQYNEAKRLAGRGF